MFKVYSIVILFISRLFKLYPLCSFISDPTVPVILGSVESFVLIVTLSPSETKPFSFNVLVMLCQASFASSLVL